MKFSNSDEGWNGPLEPTRIHDDNNEQKPRLQVGNKDFVRLKSAPNTLQVQLMFSPKERWKTKRELLSEH
jgi:hypothetical protein